VSTTIPYTIDDGESEPVEVQLPAQWVICDCCFGEGKSSAHLGSFSQEQMNEDPDFAEDYRAGAYDVPCRNCGGTGKIKEVIEMQCTTSEFKRALELMYEKVQYERERRNEQKHESISLGESRPEDWY
jgi:hypothetical protein